MRTKTLLCAAALAAGVATSMAQSNVYSLNIVGYANVPTTVGYTYQSNPFNNSNNTAGIVIPNPNPDPSGTSGQTGPWDGSSLQTWTGVGFKVALFDSLTDDTTTGFTDPNGNAVPQPVLTSGMGYLINNGGVSNVITYVGDVRGPGTNVLALASRVTPYAVGSMLPLAGGVSAALGFTNPNPDPTGTSGQTGPQDGNSIQTLKTAPNGAAIGYRVSLFDSLTDDTTTGFTDPNGNAVPEPVIPIGGGFFYVNASGSTFNWTQILTNSP